MNVGFAFVCLIESQPLVGGAIRLWARQTTNRGKEYKHPRIYSPIQPTKKPTMMVGD